MRYKETGARALSPNPNRASQSRPQFTGLAATVPLTSRARWSHSPAAGRPRADVRQGHLGHADGGHTQHPARVRRTWLEPRAVATCPAVSRMLSAGPASPVRPCPGAAQDRSGRAGPVPNRGGPNGTVAPWLGFMPTQVGNTAPRMGAMPTQVGNTAPGVSE